jgi:hypothetical protein
MDYLRLRQICLAAPELETPVADIAAIFGINICHRDPNVETFGVTNALLVAGTSFIEVVAPFQDGTAAGRFIDRSAGRGGYIALFDCPDPKPRQAHAETIGVRSAFTIDRPDSYQCVQLHPRDCRATMLEFDHSVGGDDPNGNYWPAGAHWRDHVDTSRTRGIVAIEAVSPNPQDLAAHWSAIMQRPVEPGAVPIIKVDNAEIRFRHHPDRERLETIVLDVADPEAAMAEARRRGVATGERDALIAGMIFRCGA